LYFGTLNREAVQANTSISGSLYFLSGGGLMGQIVREYNWSESSLGTPGQWPLSLRTTLGLVLHSAFPMFLFWGEELTCFYNDAYLPSLGVNGKHPAVGQPAQKVWPEIWSFIGPLISRVMQNNQAEWYEDQLLPIHRNGKLEDVYWTFSYSPAYGDSGEVVGVLVTCTETTDKVRQLLQLRESRERFRTLIREASVATCLFMGKDMRIDIANDRMISLWGKDRSVIGKTLREAVPELEGQPFLDVLNQVYETGEVYQAQEAPAMLNSGGVFSQYYFDYTYTPLKDSAGQVYGIMDMAIDVTGQVVARQMLLQSERNLRNLILKAPVAICIFKGPKFIVETANERMFELWGKTASEVLYKPIFESLPEARDQGFETLLEQVYSTGHTYFAQGVHITVPRKEGTQNVYVNFVYEAYRDADSSISGIIAVATEVTEQVLARRQIEQVVSERTQALAAANADLQKSNAELAQFAYIASHDLQEPLRKVSTFTEMLEKNLGEVGEPATTYFNKIKASTQRMISLIRDVLSFSQLAKAPETFEPVDLNEILKGVQLDFELLIEQKAALIHVGYLPVIDGIPLQMAQLFGNLFANALKFTQPGVPPVITISAEKIGPKEIWDTLIQDPDKTYYQVSVKDNGIGFEQEHANQIFHIFQRLHGQKDYSGTGIGLAMCKKIVQNHHGAIRASGRPGEGAEFAVQLPQNQNVVQ
jgi:PAS domain S-box-containing protein